MMWVGTLSGVTSAGIVISSALAGTCDMYTITHLVHIVTKHHILNSILAQTATIIVCPMQGIALDKI